MPVIACPNCGTKLNAPESVLGKDVVCGQCRQRFTAVAQPTAEQPAAPSSAQPTESTQAGQGGLDSMEFVNAPSGAAEPAAGDQAGPAAPESPTPAPFGQPAAPEAPSTGPAGFQTQPGQVGGAFPPPPPPPGQFGPSYEPSYGPQYGQPLPPAGGATASLVLGILSIPTCCCWPLGVILAIMALVFGNGAINKINTGQANPADRGKASAGRICAIIGLSLGLLAFVFWIIGMATDGAQYQYHYNF